MADRLPIFGAPAPTSPTEDGLNFLMLGGVVSPRWKQGFEDTYPASAFPGPCLAMLGDHDDDEEGFHKLAAELSCADANPSTRWTMLAKWYRVHYPRGAAGEVGVRRIEKTAACKSLLNRGAASHI